MREIKVAKSAGFCFGVKRAVDESLKIQKEFNKKIYTLGPLIHNNDVVQYLESNNIFSVNLEEIDKLNEGDVVVIRSHGVSKDVIKKLEYRGLIVKNATCPYVTNIHKKVEKYSNEGYNIVILGDENHPEVIGINGWCDNKALITKDGTLPENVPSKVCAVSQTTEKEENWKKTLNNLTSNTKEVLAFNTICNATEVNQKNADELSKTVDAMIVIGGKNSSNTTKLYQIAKRNCENTIHIENSSELPEEYINNKNFKTIGITAGASTPDWIIREVINTMQDELNKMDDQLQLMNELDRRFKIGDEVEGEILSKTRDEILVSLVGYKSDGVIPFKELTCLQDPSKFAEELKVGDSIKAKVIKLKNEDNYVVLSRLEFEKKEAMEKLEKLYNEEAIFEVKIDTVMEKGLVAHLNGVRIFIPASQIDIKFVKNKEELKGQTLEVKLIEFSKENPSKIVASRRVILEKDKAEKEEKAWSTLHLGDVVEAEIKRFTNFGAFAEINGIDGLIHLSEISWNHVRKPEDVLTKDSKVMVKIIDLDKETNKLSLSIKQLTEEPWAKVNEKYPEGTVVLGKVVRLNDFGAFVELEPGVDGLVHISKISHDRVEHPSQVLKVGEEVKAMILAVDAEKKRISLSIKDV